MKPITVRAIYRATAVAGFSAPFDSLTMKIYYPCQYSDSFDERNTGFIPADPKRAPFPVVIIMPGINLSHEAYGWCFVGNCQHGGPYGDCSCDSPVATEESTWGSLKAMY